MRKAPKQNVVELKLLYDAFAPETVETHELVWRRGKTLAHYLEGLPPEAEWMVFFNGREVELSDADKIKVGKGDRIGLILIPQGGDTFKGILRVLAMVAMIAVNFIPGLGQLASIAIAVGLGLISTFLLTPRPKTPAGQDDSQSYGIDGAKNSATEGIPYPIVYGEFRTAGNFSDCYTQNVGDNQYLYLRSVLNDGMIDSLRSIELNEQPIESYSDVQTRIGLGSLDAELNDWFGASIRQQNKGGMKIDTAWVTHITTSPVDQIRWDVTFTQGLVNIDSKKGKYNNRSVTFQMECRQIDPNTKQPTGAWTSLPSTSYSSLDLNGDGIVTIQESLIAVITGTSGYVPAHGEDWSAPAIQYRATGSNDDWTTVGTIPTDQIASNYTLDPSGDGSISGPTNITPQMRKTFTVPLDGGSYDFRGANGANIEQAIAYPTTAQSSATVTDSRTRQIRKSFTSTRLEKGYYEVRIRRTTATSTDQYQLDEVVLTDVGEIELDPVPLRGTANLSLCIKLDDQLNQIPQVTSIVRGSLCQQYDIDGNPTVKAWTNNPAWIALDMLCGEERGANVSTSRVDWPRWLELAEYCDANNLTFNGVFDTGTNLGDAFRSVLRIGHAAPVPFGTKISVAIDRPRAPVASFTNANILKGTFAISYMAMADRSNEYELTYYDKTDRNKSKVLRYVDPKAVTFNEVQRVAQVEFQGIDNAEQAKGELWRLIYANRLLIRTITFDSFLDSINITMGEVALIQHDQMQWANSGKLRDGNTTTVIQLDQPVTMDQGETYHALVQFSGIKRAQATVSSVVGNSLLVPHSDAISGPAVIDQMKRLRVGATADYEILKITPGSVYDTITLPASVSGLTSGATVEFWDTDAVEERTVASVSQNADGTTAVTLTDPLPFAPDQFSNFVFGQVEQVRKPYVLTGISGNGLEKRTLTFVEYHEGVYGPPEVEISTPVTALTDRNVAQVEGLLFDYEHLVESGRTIINARVHWSNGAIINYAGADVYMSLNGGALRAAGTAANVSEFHLQLAPGDQVRFVVVAFNRRGDRAPISAAPSVTGTIAVTFADLDPPQNVNAATVAFQVDGKVKFTWDAPVDPTGVEATEIEYRRTADTDWTGLGRVTGNSTEVSGLTTGNYVAHFRSVSSTSESVWVEKTFTVVVAPGSMMANWNSSNDRNGDPIPAPTLPAVDPVKHNLNADGSANVELDWLWDGDESTIDGFIITVKDEAPA